MSRLADESKTDRAPLRSAHRKRKMQEPPPSAAVAGLNKLKPSTMSLPPVSVPKQTHKPAASAPDMQSTAMPKCSTSHAEVTTSSGYKQPQFCGQAEAQIALHSSMSANKRAKHQQAYSASHSSASQLHPPAASTAGYDEDAETETDGSSHHGHVTQRPVGTVTSSSSVLPAPTDFFDPVKNIPLMAHVPKSNPRHLQHPELVFHNMADQLLGGLTQASSQIPASGDMMQPTTNLPNTENSMETLAHAAACASEGRAESTSSRADTEDDKDAAAILRDLRSSPSPQPSPAEGQDNCNLTLQPHTILIYKDQALSLCKLLTTTQVYYLVWQHSTQLSEAS